MTVANLLVEGGVIAGLTTMVNAVINLTFNRSGVRAEVAKQLVETDILKQQAEDKRRTEFQAQIEDRAHECEEQCRELRREVEAVRGEFYTALVGFEDRVIPRISDDALKADARKIVHDARTNLRRTLIGDT